MTSEETVTVSKKALQGIAEGLREVERKLEEMSQ